jgi:predicted nucleic acid-binding protein
MNSPGEVSKKTTAHDLVTTLSFGTSAQVLQEFYTVVTRKGTSPLTAAEAFAWVRRFLGLPFVPTTSKLILDGIALSERYQIHYWDGAIIAASEALGADTLYSEDLSHGQTYGSVRVVNPFLA